jgi:predicted AAA+ superfamily ATPase
MRSELHVHNLFRTDIQTYLHNDPHLKVLKDLKFVFHSSLEEEIPLNQPGIYILTGGRQVGKSTLIKLIIKNLLTRNKISPHQIFYIACDLLQRYQELTLIMQQAFEEMEKERYFYLFLDEITYVKDWDRTIKYFADLGYFKNGCLLITGSDSIILKEGMKKFPGRRGKAEKIDFHYYPLSFSEYVALVAPKLKDSTHHIRETAFFPEEFLAKTTDKVDKNLAPDAKKQLSRYFDKFLITGGFLPAINEYEKHKKINKFVYQTYQQWVIGDLLKRNKKETFLKDIIAALSDRLTKQISIHNIASLTIIQHHATVQEYLEILKDMDVIFIQQALREDKLKPAPKKAKKVHFADPFIAQALISWAKDIAIPWEFAKEQIMTESSLKENIVEGCVSSLLRRKYTTYYIKSEGEVDVAIIFKKKFLPVEIKWTEDLRKRDLKQILKYKKGIIGYRGLQIGRFEHLHVLPIPILALFV